MGELEAGTLVAGKYRVKRRIGAGGMGAVYEGEHVEIGKRVAIKVIEHEHARSSELAARFKREARAASAVESEHIVQVFDVGSDEKVGLYMVMELLSGEDLSERLQKSGGKIPVEDAITIGLQTARALAKAHAAGVVHRDLKPANLFLTKREDDSVCVKILDFGISKLARPDGSSATTTGNLTREGSVMGTPMYMSPEQAQGLAVDGRTDIWSLGGVLYEAMSGRTAFEHRDTYEQMIVQIVTQRAKPLRDAAPHVPDAVARVVDGALSPDVASRPADAASFARKLADAAKVPNVSTSDPTLLADAAPSSSQRVVAPPPTGAGVAVGARTQLDAGIPAKRSPLVYVAGGAVAVVAVIVGIVMATRTSTTPAAGGVVAPPPASETAVATAIPAAPALLPLETATATASASAAPSASVTSKAAASRPTQQKPPAPSATAKPASTQYGAAGVSTAY
jgi:serine/threonine protein kinase